MITYQANAQRVTATNGLRVLASMMPHRHLDAVQMAPTWREAHQDVMGWVEANKQDPFAQSLAAQFGRKGELTAGQVAAVRRTLESGAESAGQRAVEVDASKISAALAKAEASGLDKIVLRLGGFKFRPAAKYPGTVYVTQSSGDDGGVYLGKIRGGKLFPVEACTDEMRAEVAGLAVDPESSAAAYGRQTGHCACCGQKLTDPASVERGIGPICAERFF